MKKFINKLESKVGVDIDGDGRIGGKLPAGGGGSYHGGAPPQNYPPQQNNYPPQQQYPPQHQQPYYPPQQQQQQQYYLPPQQQQQYYPPQQQGYPPQQQYAPQGNVMNFHPGNGQKRALLIGINYIGQKGQLRGCVNDVNTMRSFIEAHGYSQQNMRILVDDPSWRTEMPTRQNINQAFQWLVQGARPGDNLFFHYSGHGGRVRDTNGDEADGYDETILPVDFAKAGQITDDDLFLMLVKPLAAGVRLTAVMDCCHSGTVLDLPYTFKANRSTMSSIFPNGQFNPAALTPMVANGKFNKKEFFKLGMGLASAFFGSGGHHGGGGGGQPGFQSESNKQVAGDVVMFSGCADNQTSADVANAGAGGAGGACTNSLVAAYNRRPNLTFIQLLEDMRQDLERKRYSQVPQLSSSRPLDLMQPFSL